MGYCPATRWYEVRLDAFRLSDCMTIIDLVTKEAAGERRHLLLAATLAGASNSLIIALVNITAQSTDHVAVRYFVMFALAIILYVVSARHTFHRTTHIIETALHRIRTRIIAKVERTELQDMERIGTSEIMDRITENMTVVSDSAGILANLLQSLAIIGFATIYLASLSMAAFVMLLVLVVGGAFVYLSRQKLVDEYLRRSGQERLTFFDLVTDLLKGFKEVKYNQRRSREIDADIVQSSASLRETTTNANHLFNDNYIFGNCILYALLAAMVFVLPQYSETDADTLSTLVSAVLFLWSPLSGIVGGYPAYVRSNYALAQVQALEEKLDASVRGAPPVEDAEDPWRGRFTTIETRDLEYQYIPENGAQAFRIGPINLTITAGEVLFIVGGNGSGKSTFLKVLTGLYPPTAGSVRVDATLVTPSSVAAYREMYSAIYSDFHLFAKLYGLLDIEPAEVRRLLAQMQIEDKTSYENRRFTKRNLSTGQRKRLAMIVTLLEDRPIYLFDEWAADQDPEFRRYFYEELIPMLKQRGKTVIAVSHDDRYFRCADRVVTMEYGKIRSVERIRPEAAASGAAPLP
uniref:ABC-type siderophore export system n=1 Tax=Jahnella sp. MSr9139 TaxID=1434086 RepID=A0A4Y5T0X9_9BACT|nr:ABC-type siderophore export system [Jahnella sp. MSr9139]